MPVSQVHENPIVENLVLLDTPDILTKKVKRRNSGMIFEKFFIYTYNLKKSSKTCGLSVLIIYVTIFNLYEYEN